MSAMYRTKQIVRVNRRLVHISDLRVQSYILFSKQAAFAQKISFLFFTGCPRNNLCNPFIIRAIAMWGEAKSV